MLILLINITDEKVFLKYTYSMRLDNYKLPALPMMSVFSPGVLEKTQRQTSDKPNTFLGGNQITNAEPQTLLAVNSECWKACVLV